MKSWKIGAVAGLIAGIVTGIIAIFIGIPLLYELGFGYWSFPPPPEFPFMKVAIPEIINHVIWGGILGAIYFKTYRVIPGKGALKGLVYGLFIYLIYGFRFFVYFLIYWYPNWIVVNIVYEPLHWITYGLVLGVVYEFLRNKYYVPKKEPKIIEYSMMGGFYPGAIAGFFGGIISFISLRTISKGFEEWLYPGFLVNLEYIISQLGGQILWHMMFGIILGVVFTKVYNLVPKKGIIKGLIYSLIAQFLIFELQTASFAIGVGEFIAAHIAILTGISQAVVYGLVLGYLYKPPK